MTPYNQALKTGRTSTFLRRAGSSGTFDPPDVCFLSPSISQPSFPTYRERAHLGSDRKLEDVVRKPGFHAPTCQGPENATIFTLVPQVPHAPSAAQQFLDTIKSQLTYHGPKSEDDNPAPYSLLTDYVFLNGPSVVWEQMEDIDGWAAPVGGDLGSQTAEYALRAFEFGPFAPVDPAKGISVPMHDLTAYRNTISDVIIHEKRAQLTQSSCPSNTCTGTGSLTFFEATDRDEDVTTGGTFVISEDTERDEGRRTALDDSRG
ncbi:hypothetical protein BDN67DRAFT_1015192 [Paxillus ammoniavirescens]|nr:hypothetical protein BDN67DRAFT_1015192 [Paxillus ammoniavirescens]